MIAAVDLGDLLWSLLVLYVMVHVLIATVVVVLDLIRSDDLSGARKAIWLVTLLVFPMVTVIVYLVTRGDGIGERNLARAGVPPPPPPAPGAPSPSGMSELQMAKSLLDDELLTPAEFEQVKQTILAR